MRKIIIITIFIVTFSLSSCRFFPQDSKKYPTDVERAEELLDELIVAWFIN